MCTVTRYRWQVVVYSHKVYEASIAAYSHKV